MKVSLICFTASGVRTGARIVRLLSCAGHLARPFVLGKYAAQAAEEEKDVSFLPASGLADWTGEEFSSANALVFVGACGIAVRAIAPYVRDKRTDPAVLAVDELGTFVIPLLSGHLGGANRLALFLARGICARSVITTATDLNGRFAVDVFAGERNFAIDDMKAAKAVSADLLAGEPVGLFSDFPTEGDVPDGLFFNTMCRHNIWITISGKERSGAGAERMLKLIPRCVTLGIGCRRGTPEEKISRAVSEALAENRVDARSVRAIASIDVKQNEPGLLSFAESRGLPFFTFPGEELEQVPGQFSNSEFVKRTVGVGNVCERAALRAAMDFDEKSRILFGKRAGDGVTVAGAVTEIAVRF